MSALLKFELVTPEKLLLSKAVSMVAVPGGEGDYGVLAGHAPMMTSVRCGVINVYDDGETVISDSIFVAGGFAEVTDERCTILAEEAVSLGDLDRAQLEEAGRNFVEDLSFATSDAERTAIEARIVLNKAKLQALADRVSHK